MRDLLEDHSLEGAPQPGLVGLVGLVWLVGWFGLFGVCGRREAAERKGHFLHFFWEKQKENHFFFGG